MTYTPHRERGADDSTDVGFSDGVSGTYMGLGWDLRLGISRNFRNEIELEQNSAVDSPTGVQNLWTDIRSRDVIDHFVREIKSAT